MNNTDKPTIEIANSFQSAFDYFNKHLFDNELPPVSITLNRKRGANGYYAKERFSERTKSGITLDEIAMNPDTFGRSDKSILATFVHELVHHWQHHFGINPPKTQAYHNKEWAKKMVRVGLQPISATTGNKGTGTKVGTEIMDGDRFDTLCTEFLSSYPFDLKYTSVDHETRKPTSYNKYSYRYECPNCDSWAKAPKNTNIVCGDCIELMVNVDKQRSVNIWVADSIIS